MSPLPDPHTLLKKITQETRTFLDRHHINDPHMVGIHTGGSWVAQALHQALSLKQELGTLDISFYRDDYTRIGLNPQVKPSHLPFVVEDRDILLVDDVLHTGRTIRAALNELFDYGRPRSIHLIVLLDRSGRELPIQADVSGQHLSLRPDQHIKLQGPEPLQFIFSEDC